MRNRTGQSEDLEHPIFDYDSSGTQCLDTLQDTISENNPDGLYTPEWKNRYWERPLGIEHLQWGRFGYLNCGFSARSSCRDAARVGQLWANNGEWPGHGRLISEEYVRRARTWVYPESYSWAPYGYTLWLWYSDDVDPSVSQMAGANAQCTTMSMIHDAVIVSLGQDDYDNCDAVWEYSKYAIVSAEDLHRLRHNASSFYGTGFDEIMAASSFLRAKRAAARAQFSEAEILGLRGFVANNTQNFEQRELDAINRRFVKLGAEPVSR